MVSAVGTSGFIWCQERLVSSSDAVIKTVKISPGMVVYTGHQCSLCYENKEPKIDISVIKHIKYIYAHLLEFYYIGSKSSVWKRDY